MLVFNHDGWTMVSNAWSVGGKTATSTEIVYVWGPDGVSWVSGATGTARVTAKISMDEFLARCRDSRNVIDLRDVTE